MFTGLPFVVRTLQPVLENLDAEMEEAAGTLGATRWQTFRWVILPCLLPALLTGFALAFARALGEYGSVVFISGNMPFQTEIAPVLIVGRLEEFAYAEATAHRRRAAGVFVHPARGHQSLAALEQGLWQLSRTQWMPARRTQVPGRGRRTASGRGNRTPGGCAGSLIAFALVCLGLLVVVPVVHVFTQALANGPGVYLSLLMDDADTRHAILLTLTVVPIAVVLNTVFGVAAAWAIARFRVPGPHAAGDAHRPALLGVAGGRGADVRAAVRHARLFRPVAARPRRARSFSPRRASCWPRCS